MAIKYNIVERGNPGDASAPKKFYASSVATGNVGIEEITNRVEKISTVSGADIRAVLYSLIDVVPDLLGEGSVVEIGDLGRFQVSISSNGEETAEKVSANSIKSAKILFRPGKKFKTMLKTLSYQKA